MKAIKLASVFAVSAVAAAVSTSTLAAEPVFKGTAGLSYKMVDEGDDGSQSEGEVNIIGDTGLVYFDLDMEGSTASTDDDGNVERENDGNTALNLDEIYVKMGAVQFGDFDGTIADDAAFSAGVEEDLDDAKDDLGTNLGIRYMVMDGFTVAVESKEFTDKASAAFLFTTTAGGVDLGISGAAGSDDSIVTLGASLPLGMASISAFYVTGEKSDLDVTNYGVGLDLALTESFSAAFQYYTQEGESAVGVDLEDQGISEFTLNYTVGDIRYFATSVAYEIDGDDDKKDYSIIGAEASF